MPVNTQTDGCISREGGALVFWAPGREPKRQGSRVQIVDVFALQVATGYTRDPQGRLLLEAQPVRPGQQVPKVFKVPKVLLVLKVFKA